MAGGDGYLCPNFCSLDTTLVNETEINECIFDAEQKITIKLNCFHKDDYSNCIFSAPFISF